MLREDVVVKTTGLRDKGSRRTGATQGIGDVVGRRAVPREGEARALQQHHLCCNETGFSGTSKKRARCVDAPHGAPAQSLQTMSPATRRARAPSQASKYQVAVNKRPLAAGDDVAGDTARESPARSTERISRTLRSLKVFHLRRLRRSRNLHLRGPQSRVAFLPQ
jgi:hypothetical protein